MVPTIIIGAGGKQTRWSGTTPKHLVKICGEPLLVRTLRQLKNHKVYVLSDNPDIIKVSPTAIMPAKSRYVIEAYLNTKHLWGEQTVLMHGDVLYGAETMRKILNYRGKAMFFGSQQEMMALSFNDKEEVAEAIQRALDWVVENEGMGKMWEIYRAYNDLPLDKHDLGREDNHELVYDYSIDFDTVDRYKFFMRHHKDKDLVV